MKHIGSHAALSMGVNLTVVISI